MAKQREIPVGFYLAWERVLPFLERLHAKPGESISNYVTQAKPRLNYTRLIEAVELLEKYYGGITLFNRAQGRSGRNVLTEKGKQLLMQAKEGFGLVEARIGAVPLRVRIAAFGFSLGARLAGPITKVLAKHDRRVSVDFRPYRDVRAALAGLALKQVHCVFAARSPKEAAGLESEVTFRPTPADIFPVLIHQAGTDSPKPEEFKTQRWVLPQHLVAEWAELIPRPAGKSALGWVRVPTFFEVLEFVRGGDGISRAGVEVHPWSDAPGVSFGAYVAKDFDRNTPERVRSFLNEVFAGLGIPTHPRS
jgi:DNA-binding transcriptional LysR family regulator